MKNDLDSSHGRHTPARRPLSRRSLLTAAGALALPGSLGAARPPHRRPRVLIATNEPWGTYHVKPLLPEATRRGWRLTQLVPDHSQIKPGDPVPTATPDQAPDADLIVVTGAGDWPLECANRFRALPLAASSLAYLGPDRAPGARRLRNRLRLITSQSPAEARSFGHYLGTNRRIVVTGSPQADTLPTRAPEPGLVLVLTSVTRDDETGGAAPGTQLLLDAAANLQAAGKRILVGIHPREDRTLWDQYEISDVPSLQASARAQAAIGIPGTVFPLIAAVGTPLVGCTDPALTVPDYLLAVCSSTIDKATDAATAIQSAEPPRPDTLADAVGPIGGSTARLLHAWSRVASRRP
ncbi:hypothetical protein OHR68_40440 [Spirillospora sp. NBC_00431]